MSVRLRQLVAAVLLGGLVTGGLAAGQTSAPTPAPAPEQLTRKVKSKVNPVYPDIARRMGIAGTVRVSVVVEPNGTVKSAKVVGGHPLLINAALDALKKWKFESAAEESTGTVEFKFQPQD